jgi:Ser/Thr protein kinase RdoA (MazF antagonist)
MSEAFKILEHADPPVGEAQALELLRRAYGLEGTVRRLPGERDQNFEVAAGGERFVLKISHSAEEPAVTDFQTRALLHIAASSAQVPIPRLQATLNGEPQFLWRGDGRGDRVVRLLSFLEGVPLHSIPPSRAVLWSLGSELARLDLALRDFRHPAEDYVLLWDLRQAHLLDDRIEAVATAEDRKLAQEGLAVFRQVAVPRLAGLRAQTIHNDANPWNVLVDAAGRAVTGLLDLGDALRAPLIMELGVAASYHLEPDGNPFRGVSALVSGYHQRLPLDRVEREILCPLMAARLAMTVVITSWRCRLHPHNSAYILRNVPRAARGLEYLLGQRTDAATTWPLSEIAAELAGGDDRP